MILRELPDSRWSGFDFSDRAEGWPNTILHATGSRGSLHEHAAPLSIRCTFNGEEVYEVEGARHVVNDTSYLILNHGQRCRSHVRSPRGVETFCVFFRPGFAEEVLSSLTLPAERLLDDPSNASGGPVHFIEKLYHHRAPLAPVLQRVRSAVSAGPVDEDWLDEQFHEMLDRLVATHREVVQEIDRIPAIRLSTKVELYRRLYRAKEFIDDSPVRISLADMASVACLSPHHFLRLFKQLFGQTPHQYLTGRRLERARELLTGTDMSVGDVCLAVGFESLGSFSWLFSRRVGASPERYRTSMRAALSSPQLAVA